MLYVVSILHMDFLYDHIIKIMTTNIFMTCSQIVEIETTIKMIFSLLQMNIQPEHLS